MSHCVRPGTNQVPDPALGRRYCDGQLSRKERENQTDKIYKHLLYTVYKIFANLKSAYLYGLISFHSLNQIILRKYSRIAGMSFKMSRSRFASEICNLLLKTLGDFCHLPKPQFLNLLNVVNNWTKGNDVRKTLGSGMRFQRTDKQHPPFPLLSLFNLGASGWLIQLSIRLQLRS